MALPEFKAGDVISCHGENAVSWLIRWAERRRGEAKSYANHTAGFRHPCFVVEALWTVKDHPYSREWFPEKHQIWRHRGLTDAQREQIGEIAKSYIGRKYGPLKIVLHLGDALISKVTGKDVNLFRRLASIQKYPICSWVWAYAYHEAIGYKFLDKDPSEATPDDILDHMMRSDDWELILDVTTTYAQDMCTNET